MEGEKSKEEVKEQEKAQEQEKEKEKSFEKKKEEHAPLDKLLSQRIGGSKKKIRLGEKEYYVVTLDEVDHYKSIKDQYRDDSMSAFILYMHTEFGKDLKKLRKSSTSSAVMFWIIFILLLLVAALIVFFIIKGALGNK
ncbi:hypothetical protein NEFER03_0705 [Nematocida sp. LUAm3]|nr:hypothetical protein NEFER03_0705 [Nematocida sp. LUAm3]KAI5175164.1 hypothetical protein NEFER02_1125 [Nematocida sp. LUAm2]KAI5178164.1 hypothetical protein NEFER01_1342 [Nematocida sp. LUAm1]